MNEPNKQKKHEMKVTTLVSIGLCVIALGAGVTYYAWNSKEEPKQTQPVSPAVSPKTPKLEMAKEVREAKSKDDADKPLEKEDAKPQAKQPVKQPAKPQVQETAEAFIYPVKGEILMDYSMEKAIYDPTLDQYRTNDTISIGAAQGTPVLASADGTVEEVKDDVKQGKTVVITHKDGWRTTYSPLAEDITVKKGDTVKQGQEIGQVAKPVGYGAGLADHLCFGMEQNGQKKDPKKQLP